MFRVITALVEKPSLLMLCDDPACGMFFSSPLPDSINTTEEAEIAFATVAVRQGWGIRVSGHLCPHHNQQKRAAAPLVEVAHTVPEILN